MTVVWSFDGHEVDAERGGLRAHGEAVKLDRQVLDLLLCLLRHEGKLVAHETLIAQVWGGRAVSDNTVSVCVAKLRKALGHRRGDHEVVVNEYGQGYRFARPLKKRSLPASSGVPGSTAPATMEETRAPAFVGRESVMQRLQATMRGACQGNGKLCALLGEPGVGKTRVAEALQEAARSAGMAVAWGRSHELESSPPLWPFVQLVRQLLLTLGQERAGQALGNSMDDLARLLPESGVAPADDLDSNASARFAVYDAMARLLSAAGAQQPQLLVLDDMHKGDAASIELLAYLVEELAGFPVLLVVTLRDTESARTQGRQRRLDYLLGHRNTERMHLERLQLADVERYTETLMGEADEALARAVFARSEGNAFFMTELLRERAEHGGAAAGSPQLSGAALDLIRQRLERLDRESRGILQAASIQGRSFELPVVAAVLDRSPAQLLEALDEPLATEVVVAAPQDPARFAFGHELFREVLYGEQSQSECRRLHHAMATVLERRRAGGGQLVEAELAHHRLSALPYGEMGEAVRATRRAARIAASASAFHTAAALLRRALAALEMDPDPAQRCRLHYELSLVTRPIDGRSSVAELQRARELADAHGLATMQAHIGLHIVRTPGVVMAGDARALLESALSGLPEEDTALRARVLAHLCWCAPTSYDGPAVEELLARARDAVDHTGDVNARLDVLRARIHLASGPDTEDGVCTKLLAEASELIADQDEASRTRWRLQEVSQRAVTAIHRGNRAALDAALDPEPFADRARHAELLWHLERRHIIDRMNQGQLTDFPSQIEALQQRGATLQLFAHERVCAYDRLRYQDQCHGLPAADADADAGLRLRDQDAPSVAGFKLRMALMMDLAPAARRILDVFRERGLRRLPRDRDFLGVMAQLALAADQLQDVDAAGTLYAMLCPYAIYYTTDVALHCDGSVSHLLGLLARQLGDMEQAARHFSEAVKRNLSFGLLGRVAESRYELAAVYLQRNEAARRPHAAELLRRAQRGCEVVGLRPLSEKARRLLSTVT